MTKHKSVGFTGTRKGMTAYQKQRFVRHLLRLRPQEFHHGDDAGADADAHKLCRQTLPDCRIIVHPPTDSKHRAFTAGDIVLPAFPYLQRNHHIVDACTCLLSTPEGPEVLRSGTWATIRYARKRGRKRYIIGRSP